MKMDTFSEFKKDILDSAVSGNDQYCTGSLNGDSYIIALVAGQGAFQKTFSHAGSHLLDSIVAYDRAEVSGPYIGQINMITVSSFCGPKGLIWGYDMAKVECPEHPLLNEEDKKSLNGVIVREAAPLREAAARLFGTNNKRHFPFFPGSHVPCAGKFLFFEGPTAVYSAVAIGIPEDRSTSACVLMEDVGELSFANGSAGTAEMKSRLVMNMAKSVLAIGKNQLVNYKEVLVDITAKNVSPGEIGCALASMPYLNLAKNAYDQDLLQMTLKQWTDKKQNKFLQ